MSELLEFLSNNVPQFRISRLSALYSDFEHLRTTNPEGYAANISAWLQGLALATRAGVIPTTNKKPDIFSISINQKLLSALESENGWPLSLGTVVRDGIEKGHLIPYKEYMESPSSIYQKNWTLRPWDFLSKSLKQLGIISSYRGDELPEGEFIIVENLEFAAKIVKKKFKNAYGRSERIFTRTTFAENFGSSLESNIPLSDSDMELFLKFLARDMALVSYNSEMVKLRLPNEADEITFDDTTIASLKSLMEDLSNQIKVLTQKYDGLTMTAKEAVSKKNRIAALAALRLKNLTNQTLEKRYATLTQLEEVLNKIEQASSQVELLKVMEASTEVMEKLNQGAIALGSAEKIVDKLHDQMQSVDEIDISNTYGLELDEDSLDLELENIQQEENEKIEVKEREEKALAEELETKLKLDALKEIDQFSQVAKARILTESEVQKELANSTELLENLSLALDTKVTE